MKQIIILFIAITLSLLDVRAQETDFSIGADIVSSYVWRGAYQTSTAIQPSMEVSAGNFSLSAWGSIPFVGGDKEVDFALAYATGGLSIAITDYWWAGEGAYKYFTYSAHETDHHFEASVGYTLPTEKFPLSLSWNTLFAGQDYYKADCKRAYSTYISAAYPFGIKEVDLEAEIGITPWEGMYAESFSVTNIALKASKEIRITEFFSLPIFAQVISNPTTEDIFLVFGISL